MSIDHMSEAKRLELEASREFRLINSQEITHDRTWVAVSLLLVGMSVVAVAYFFAIGGGELPSSLYYDKMTAKERFELRGLFGDQWGAFTGIVSGLTFAFVALSLFAQRAELKMSRRELAMQRVELKYARAQSHRQIRELEIQRSEERRREKFAKEPIVLASAIVLCRSGNTAELSLLLDHHGPAACNMELFISFNGLEEMELPAPQVLKDEKKISYPLKAAGFMQVEKLAGLSCDLELATRVKYRNLAGGGFCCEQKFRISSFQLKSFFLPTNESGIPFEAIHTSFSQLAEIL